MEKGKNQTVKKDDRSETSTQVGTKETSAFTDRPNIDVITARNEEEVKQDKILTYKRAGLGVLLAVFIIIAIYFFS